MTTLLALFLLTLLFSASFVPLVRLLGLSCGAIDSPGSRKVHSNPVPRCGGMAIFFAFMLGILVIFFLETRISEMMSLNKTMVTFLIGAVICFLIGLLDDFRQTDPWIKLSFQVLATTIAFLGGLHIAEGFFAGLGLPDYLVLACSYFLTVFWFVLFINAVNLIDGLDGLAGGIIFFTCMVMIIFLVMERDFLMAIYFVLLGGSVAGFLPYNFNNSFKTFMGDSGSYFLGYCVAGLAIMGSLKSQVGATMTIPLLAMGLPVFDTIIAPVRRFFRAKSPLKPDKDHLHHRLLARGFSTQRTVLVLYGITLCLSLAAIILVNLEDEQMGLFLVLTGAMAVVFASGLGYFGYMGWDKVQYWLLDLSFVAGMAKDRRRFLNLQVAIGDSTDIYHLWANICRALEELDMDFAEVHLFDGRVKCKSKKSANQVNSSFFHDSWSRNGFDNTDELCKENLFKLELPIQYNEMHLGEMWIVKDLNRSPINHYTLTRIEHMRRSVSNCLKKMSL